MPKIICFEGGEGSGKSTLIKNYAKKLCDEGYKVFCTREPGGTNIGEQIRNLIVSEKNSGMCPMTEALLFAACRAQFVKDVIKPHIEANDVDYILMDRYIYSSYVYQGIVGGVGLDTVIDINDKIIDCIYPDFTFYLDIDPIIGQERIRSNKRETNRFDNKAVEYHNEIRKIYLSLFVSPQIRKNTKCLIVDASKTEQEILNEVYSFVKEGKKIK